MANEPTTLVHDREHAVFGTFDDTTAWRLAPIGQGLSFFRFEDIAGDTVPIPDNISMIRLDASGYMPHPLTGQFAPRIGHQYVLQQGCSYTLAETTLGGNARQSLINITNKQYHEVTEHRTSEQQIKMVRSERVNWTPRNNSL